MEPLFLQHNILNSRSPAIVLAGYLFPIGFDTLCDMCAVSKTFASSLKGLGYLLPCFRADFPVLSFVLLVCCNHR